MKTSPQRTKGLWVGFSSYLLWGFFPIYWKLLGDRGSLEILSHRFVWALAFYLLLFFLTQKKAMELIRGLQLRELVLGFLSALLLGINWGFYIYAVKSGQILEGSLAYFINPILNVLVGVLFFQEKIPLVLKISTLLAAIGVAFKIQLHPSFPYVALILAVTFCMYGVVKKLSQVPAGLSSVGLELDFIRTGSF